MRQRKTRRIKKQSPDLKEAVRLGMDRFQLVSRFMGSMGISNDRKRSSDYSAGIEWRILAKKQEAPEALMKIIDAMVRMQDKVTDMNMSIVEAEAETLRAAAFPPGGDADSTDTGADNAEGVTGNADDSSDGNDTESDTESDSGN